MVYRPVCKLLKKRGANLRNFTKGGANLKKILSLKPKLGPWQTGDGNFTFTCPDLSREQRFDHENVPAVLGIYPGFAKRKVNIAALPCPNHAHRGCGYKWLLHNDPKFSDRQVWSKQCSLMGICTVCHWVCIFWSHYSMVKPPCSNFRVIYTANISGVRTFTVL